MVNFTLITSFISIFFTPFFYCVKGCIKGSSLRCVERNECSGSSCELLLPSARALTAPLPPHPLPPRSSLLRAASRALIICAQTIQKLESAQPGHSFLQ